MTVILVTQVKEISRMDLNNGYVDLLSLLKMYDTTLHWSERILSNLMKSRKCLSFISLTNHYICRQMNIYEMVSPPT